MRTKGGVNMVATNVDYQNEIDEYDSDKSPAVALEFRGRLLYLLLLTKKINEELSNTLKYYNTEFKDNILLKDYVTLINSEILKQTKDAFRANIQFVNKFETL